MPSPYPSFRSIVSRVSAISKMGRRLLERSNSTLAVPKF
jgi:hypothetical protein